MGANDIDIRGLQDRVTALEQGGGGGVTFAAVQTALGAASSAVDFNGQPITNADISGLTIPPPTFSAVQTALAAASGTVSFNGEPIDGVASVNGAPLGADAHECSAFGIGALATLTVGTNGNTAFGFNALNAATTGPGNTAFGANALRALTTRSSNVAIGLNCMQGAIDSDENTGVGAAALAFLTTGDSNVAIGALAGNGVQTGARNVAIGHSALHVNLDGSDNVCIGQGAGLLATTGDESTLVGGQAGAALTTGAGNTFLGFQAGGPSVTGFGNVCIGALSGQDLGAGDALRVCIGNLQTLNTSLLAGDLGTAQVAIGDTTGWQAAHPSAAALAALGKDGGDEREIVQLTSKVAGAGSHAATALVFVGDRDPTGAVAAPSGSLYVRKGDASSNVYVNQSVGTGTTWAALL